MCVKQNNVKDLGLTREPKIEQAMAWLVEHGPLHESPNLPSWILHDLVEAGRIAKLRRGLYLAPTADGRMLSLPAVATQLAPRGYLSFYAALVRHGLTDQDTGLFAFITHKRQPSLRLGAQRLDFVPWPARLRNADVVVRRTDPDVVRLATPAQALMDALEAPRFVPNWPELLHVLRTGIALRKLSPAALRARARAVDSTALARRLGLLLELETGKVDKALLAIAHRSNNWTRLAGIGSTARARDARWRLELPRAREDIVAAVRE
jgi:predicted transcriptional regulator of viral defense system